MVRVLRFAPILALVLVVSVACGSSGSTTSTPPVAVGTPSAVATAPAAQSTASPAATVAATRTAVPGRLGTLADLATTQQAPDFQALPGATASFGKLGDAVFQIEVPTAWNGDLVMYAHGFVGFGITVAVEPPPRALREQLISQGYAWAASSFSQNGYTPGIGADDTLALKGYFERQFSKPKRVYLVGASMGGNVVTLSLEHYGDQYDGALAACGAVGGEEIIDYLTSWTALAEYTSGVPFPIGEGAAKMTPVLLQDVPKELGSPDAPTNKGKVFASAVKNLTGGPRPFFAEGFKEQYLVNFGLLLLDPDRKALAARAGTNVGVTYDVDDTLGVTDAQLNAGIQRLKADPDARNAATHPDAVPTTGKITKPLLTIHGTGDLFVPISQEQSYRQKVEALGKGDLLVQRAIRSAGHCKFSDTEYTTAFNDLVAWVKDGKKPAGDDLRGDLTDIGKQFTSPLRAGDPGGR